MIFFAIFGCKRVNCNETGGDRPRLPPNRKCYRLCRVLSALAQISCFIIIQGLYDVDAPALLVCLVFQHCWRVLKY